MKPRVINGKRYNVHTSNLVGKKDGLALYRKTTGEYFATEDGEYILLRNDFEETKAIARKVLTEKEYIFELEIQESERVNASLELPEPIHEKVAALAKESNSNIRETIIRLLFDQLY